MRVTYVVILAHKSNSTTQRDAIVPCKHTGKALSQAKVEYNGKSVIGRKVGNPRILREK